MIKRLLRGAHADHYLSTESYAGTQASTGQTEAHVAQAVHFSWSITYLSSPAEMALSGHSGSHAPQEMQSSVIV
jgi:hypothetical protein